MVGIRIAISVLAVRGVGNCGRLVFVQSVKATEDVPAIQPPNGPFGAPFLQRMRQAFLFGPLVHCTPEGISRRRPGKH